MRFDKTPGELVAEISMERADAFNGCLLVVEHLDDKKFWQAFVNRASCRILQSHGRSVALTAICMLETLNRLHGVLALVDDDLDSILGRRVSHGHVIYTDAHDLEAVLIRSGATLRTILEYADIEQLARFEASLGSSVAQGLLARALPLARLRCRAQRDEWPVSFKKVTCFKLIDAVSWDLDTNALAAFLTSQDAGLHNQLLQLVMNESVEGEPWYLCHGHDLVQILCVALTGPLKAEHLGPQTLSAALRLAFTFEDLEHTDMHAAVLGWEARMGIKVLKNN